MITITLSEEDVRRWKEQCCLDLITSIRQTLEKTLGQSNYDKEVVKNILETANRDLLSHPFPTLISI